MLISKDENIKASAVYVGSLILGIFRKSNADKLTLFEISDHLKTHQVLYYRQIFFGLALLYATDIIRFDEPYIWINLDQPEFGLETNSQSKLFDFE